MRLLLNTGRTVDQGVSMERGKTSSEYFEKVAVAFIHPDDMKELGIDEGDAVRIETDFGSTVLKCVKGGTEKGTIFVPMGPWANVLTGPNTEGSGMPSLKGLTAEISGTKEKVTTLDDILRMLGG